MKDKDKTKKQLIKELRESEEKLRSFVKSSTIGIWCFKPEEPVDITLPEERLLEEVFKSICVECNDTYARMLGTTRDKILGIRLSEIEPDTEENREYLRDFIHNGFKLSGGISHEIDKKGNEKYFSNSFVGVIKDGKVIEAWGTQTDITEQKKVEKLLRFEQGQLRSIFDGIDEIVYVADPETYEVLYINQPLRNSFGDVVGQKCFKAFQNLDTPCPFCTNDKIFGENIGKTYLWEWQNKINKRWYHCIDRAIRWPDGRWVRYEMAIDITDSRRMSKELRERRMYLESVIDSTPDAIITADDKQRILEWNPGAERLFGYLRDEVIGKELDNLITGSNPDALKEATALTHQILVEKKSVPPTKAVRYRKDGTPVDVILAGSPILLRNRFIGVIATYTDITEHKREEKIRESIYRIAGAVTTTKNLNELFDFIHNTIKGLMPAENAYIAFYDSNTDMISFPYFVDEYDKTPQPKRPGKGFTEYILRTKRPLLLTSKEVSRLQKEENLEIVGTIAVSWVGIPLIIDEEVIGVLVVQSYTKGIEYTEGDKEVLQYISSQIAQAIRYKRAEEKLHEQMSELQAFYRVTVGRETRIIELKHEVNKLLERLGEKKKYKA